MSLVTCRLSLAVRAYNSAYALAMLARLYVSRTRCRAASASWRRVAGSAARVSRTWASASASPAGTSRPHRPASRTSGTPPTAVATHGRPADIASSNALGCASLRLGSTKRSNSARKSSTWSTRPANWHRPAMPSRLAVASNSVRKGPSPARRSCASRAGTAWQNVAKARSSSSWCLTGVRLPTVPTMNGPHPPDRAVRGERRTPLGITPIRPGGRRSSSASPSRVAAVTANSPAVRAASSRPIHRRRHRRHRDKPDSSLRP